ncbi:MAG: hypothetical protein IJV07_02640 [Alphaproteobacteria bacterium]|nr:hypothetical protein [Alphaproteobacteria bacterium]
MGIKFNNKTLGALYAVAMTAMGTGCVSMNGQASSRPNYEGYLDPKAEDFAVVKEAYQNQGKVVEATFVNDGQGHMVAVYGVREKTGWESSKAWLADKEEAFKVGDRLMAAGSLATDIMGVHYQAKEAKAVKGVQRAVNRNTSAIMSLRDVVRRCNKTNTGCGNSGNTGCSGYSRECR